MPAAMNRSWPPKMSAPGRRKDGRSLTSSFSFTSLSLTAHCRTPPPSVPPKRVGNRRRPINYPLPVKRTRPMLLDGHDINQPAHR